MTILIEKGRKVSCTLLYDRSQIILYIFMQIDKKRKTQYKKKTINFCNNHISVLRNIRAFFNKFLQMIGHFSKYCHTVYGVHPVY